MTKAKAGAMLAFFSEIERREKEHKAQTSNVPWERPLERAIEVDLAALHRAMRKVQA